MEIWHRVGFNGDIQSRFKERIDQLGIKYEVLPMINHKVGLIYFDITESDSCWDEVSELIQKNGASDVYQTIFDKEEILASQWLRLIPIFECGYPQPKDTWVGNPDNYTEYCSECGTFHQASSFHLKTEPNLRKHDFMTLIWGSALFCTPKVLEEFETHSIQGYEAWKAIIHSTGIFSKKIFQLFFQKTTKPGLARVDELKRTYCSICKTLKYYPHMKGIMYVEREAIIPNTDFLLSYEWFGDGHVAYREILVSNRVAQLILKNNWQGTALKVVELI